MDEAELHVDDETEIRCPKCGQRLPDDFVSRLFEKAGGKELGFLILGVVLGAIVGLVGNFWVSFTLETLRSTIPETQWLLSSILGLTATSIISIYVLVKMFRIATRYMGPRARDEIQKKE